MNRFIQYIRHTIGHKIAFWKPKNLKSKLIEYGPTFLIIVIIVELLEHFGLPILFYYLGNNVHEFFYVLIPTPLMVCLHFITAPLVFFIYISIKKRKTIKISNFYQNVLTLFTGVSIAQLIPIIITPILTQFFTPEDFGVYGLYISICSILGVVASAKYDVAIMLPRSKKDGINILALSFLITFLFSSLCFSILNIFNTTFFELTQSKLLEKYYFIIPFSIFLISINQSIVVWLNRSKKYHTISSYNFIKSSSNSGAALVLGAQSINAGLIISHMISLITISFFNILHLIKEFDVSLINQNSMKKNFVKYIDFLKFSSLSNLFNACSNIGMTTIIIVFFGPKTAGLYFLAEKLIAIPISFITSSVSQVYFEKASKLFHTDKKALLDLTNQIQKNIFYILVPLLVICSFFGESLFGVFGNEWSKAGVILKYFAVFILFKNIYSPISHIGDILNKQKVLLFFNISLFLFQVSAFYMLKEYENINMALLTASILGATHYVILNIYMKKELLKIT